MEVVIYTDLQKIGVSSSVLFELSRCGCDSNSPAKALFTLIRELESQESVEKFLKMYKIEKDGLNDCLKLSARYKNRISIMELLIEYGADPSIAIFDAIKSGNLDVVEYLVEKEGASLVDGGVDPLFLACQYNHPYIAQFLIERGLIPSKKCVEYSAYYGFWQILRVLLKQRQIVLDPVFLTQMLGQRNDIKNEFNQFVGGMYNKKLQKLLTTNEKYKNKQNVIYTTDMLEEYQKEHDLFKEEWKQHSQDRLRRRAKLQSEK
jgi:hypothetical protein